MKAATVLFVLLIAAQIACAQSSRFARARVGFFAGPSMKLTALNGEFATMVGISGGVMLNKRLVIGGEGYFLLNQLVQEDSNTIKYYFQDANGSLGFEGYELRLHYYYLGPFVEYFFPTRSNFAFSGRLLMAYGVIAYRYFWTFTEPAGFYGQAQNKHHDQLFIFEPGAGFEYAVAPWLHMHGALSWRLVVGIDHLKGLSESDLGGPSLTITGKVGVF